MTEKRRQPWSATHADAWIGLLETHKHLTREIDAQLESEHGLTISSFELLTRLANAKKRMLQLTTLANEAGLSLSRVSRILDTLERRGLVERRPSAEDTRAKNAWLTPQGVRVQRSAEETFSRAAVAHRSLAESTPRTTGVTRCCCKTRSRSSRARERASDEPSRRPTPTRAPP
jgi:DNA-binding MarR family transcriptional regulator